MQIVTLSDVCKINPKHKLAALSDDMKVSFIAMADISEITKSIKSFSEKNLKDTRKGFTHLLNEDVIVAKITPCYENGKMAIVKVPHSLGFGSTEFHVFRPDLERLIPKFLFYFLCSPSVRACGAKNMTGSAGQKRVPIKFFQNLQIPLPSREEQNRIVRELDVADALRQKRKQAIALLDDYLKVVFSEMFGDVATNSKNFPVNELGDKLELITYGLTVRPKYLDEGIPLISAKEIRSGYINYSLASKISNIDFQSLTDKAKPNRGDILFSKTGSIGHCAIVSSEIVFAITQNAARLKFKKEVNPVFALYYLRTPFIQNLSNLSAKGNAVKDLQLGVMKKFKFITPPIEMQNQFAEVAYKIGQLKKNMRSQSEQIDSNFKALMQRTFNQQ